MSVSCSRILRRREREREEREKIEQLELARESRLEKEEGEIPASRARAWQSV